MNNIEVETSALLKTVFAQWGYMLFSIIFAIATGILTNVFFFIAISQLRPRVIISPWITKGLGAFDKNFRYRFKIVNRTKAPLVDIRADLLLVRRKSTPEGIVNSTKRMSLLSSDVTWINAYSRGDKETSYAYRFSTDIDIEKEWIDEGSHLRFRVFARHGTSGIGKIIEQNFLEKNCIVLGEFEIGEGLSVKSITLPEANE